MSEATLDPGKQLESAARNIHPGEWAIDDARPIATLLGSCVAVCLYDPQLHIGGANHFMLPIRTRSTDSEYDSLLRGDYAMEVLVNAMLNRGARKQRLIAKAFGGGNVVTALRRSIGDGNIAFTRTWLEREEIALSACDFGGPWARKIVFNPSNGDAYCKRVDSSQSVSAQVAQEETAYENFLVSTGKTSGKEIELF